MWGEQSFGSDLSWLAHDEFFFFPSRGNSISVQNGIFFFFFCKLQQIRAPLPAQNQAIQFRGFVFGRGMYGV